MIGASTPIQRSPNTPPQDSPHCRAYGTRICRLAKWHAESKYRFEPNDHVAADRAAINPPPTAEAIAGRATTPPRLARLDPDEKRRRHLEWTARHRQRSPQCATAREPLPRIANPTPWPIPTWQGPRRRLLVPLQLDGAKQVRAPEGMTGQPALPVAVAQEAVDARAGSLQLAQLLPQCPLLCSRERGHPHGWIPRRLPVMPPLLEAA
jgi:hypothetical protein